MFGEIMGRLVRTACACVNQEFTLNPGRDFGFLFRFSPKRVSSSDPDPRPKGILGLISGASAYAV